MRRDRFSSEALPPLAGSGDAPAEPTSSLPTDEIATNPFFTLVDRAVVAIPLFALAYLAMVLLSAAVGGVTP